jgi:LysM repeat protein
MSEKESPKDVIDAYRKKQARTQKMPTIIFVLAALLIIAGAAAIIFWVTSKDKPQFSLSSLFASDTPTPTETVTPSPVPPTVTPSLTPTEPPPTDTPTITLTPTISGPFIYVVEEGDSLYSIAERFGVDVLVLIEVNRERLGLDPANPVIKPGDEILVPPAGTELSTPTPLPEGLPRGTRIEYMVQSGDTLAAIALKFNSTVEDILDQNDALEDANAIFPGQILIIRVNLVTPVPTAAKTEAPASTPGTISTLTPTP